MKKIIAFVLSLVLVAACLCSCGKADISSDAAADNNGGYNIEYKNLTAGYISHTSDLDATIMKSDTFECMDDFYIFLPKGTELSYPNNFAVYCYNNQFALDTALTEGCGQNMLRYSVQVSSDVKTLSADCYVRLSVEGKVKDVTITVPDGLENQVLTGTKEDLLFAPQIKAVENVLTGRESAINYIFITDLHYDKDPTSQKSEALFKQVKAAVEIANSNDSIDFIAIGGDTTSGMYATKAEALKYTAEILEPLKQSRKPVFVAMGNHDDNSYHSFHTDGFNESEIVSDKDWSDNIIKTICPENIVKDSKYTDSKYYYYDLTAKKTRVICLDALDYRAKYDANGVIKTLPVKDANALNEKEKYWSGTSYWGYSEGQMQWLTREAMTAPDDWNYMFISHMGVDIDTMSNHYETKYGATLRSILAAYKDRRLVSNSTVSADFTRAKGKVLSYHFGHTHRELTKYSKDIDLWQICTATAQVSTDAAVIGAPKTEQDTKGNDWVSYDRKYGSENEACMDIISATSSDIVKFALGAGSNEDLKYE